MTSTSPQEFWNDPGSFWTDSGNQDWLSTIRDGDGNLNWSDLPLISDREGFLAMGSRDMSSDNNSFGWYSASADSASSAFSQCSDAVVRGPPKKGRRRHGTKPRIEHKWLPPTIERVQTGGNADVDQDEKSLTARFGIALLRRRHQQLLRLRNILHRENDLLREALKRKGFPVEEIVSQQAHNSTLLSDPTPDQMAHFYSDEQHNVREQWMSKIDNSIGSLETTARFDHPAQMTAFASFPGWCKALERLSTDLDVDKPTFLTKGAVSEATNDESNWPGLADVLAMATAAESSRNPEGSQVASKGAPAPRAPGSSVYTASSNGRRVPNKKRRVRHSKSKRKSRLSIHAINILSEWLGQYPAEEPTKDSIHLLADQTGLSPRRVGLWLQNARAEHPFPLQAWLMSSADEDSESDVNIENTLLSMAANTQPNQDIDGLGLTSSFQARPGHEPMEPEITIPVAIPEQVVQEAASLLFEPMDLDAEPIFSELSGPDLLTILNPEPALPDDMLNISLAATPGDATHPQVEPLHSNEGIDQSQTLLDSTHIKPIFQCTFCRETLTEGAWKRHEESMHMPRVTWTCMGGGDWPLLYLPVEETLPHNNLSVTTYSCVFCPAIHSNEFRADVHTRLCHKDAKIDECIVRPPIERTFNRRDSLQQHATQWHGCKEKLRDEVVKAWENKSHRDQTWICGFCGDSLSSWGVRATHIKRHFREGKTMDDWIHGPV